ncbi:MAG TPA: hypothetical protein VHK47_19915 [Polyangia bacterium]|nr:hypothetical protein [Polyangia bacterium]
MRTWSTAMVLAMLACGLAACSSFPDVSTVTDLRVLAVKADPPEVFVKVTGLPDPSMPGMQIDPTKLGIDPASIPMIRMTPLIVDPRAGLGAITWDIRACPNDPFGPAPPGSVMGGPMDPGGGANNTVGSTLCDAATPRLAAGLDPTMPYDVQLTPEQLRDAFRKDVFVDQYGNPHGGFDLGMPLNFQIDVHEGGALVQTIKRVTFWARPWPDQAVDQIPTIPSVAAFGDRDPATFDLLLPMGTLSKTTPVSVSLTSGKGLWLLPEYHAFTDDPAIATDEHYRPTIINRDPPYQVIEGDETDERIRYAFYATAGHFDPPRSVNQLVPGTVGTIHLESHYIPPATLSAVPVDAAGQHLVTVWVVVRDDRGGESWLEGRIALEP